MSKYEMIDVSTATSIVLDRVGQEKLSSSSNSVENVQVSQTLLGRYLAEDVEASEPFPPFLAAVLDGYAFNDQNQSNSEPFSDFTVVGYITAGKEVNVSKVEGSQCVYVTTGSKLPPGTNTVVGIEKTEPITSNHPDEIKRVRINGKFAAGANVRPVGKDISVGTKCLRRSCKLKSAEIGVLATLGRTHVNVYKRIKVGVLSTGNELVSSSNGDTITVASDATTAVAVNSSNERTLPEGCIYDANRVGLLSLLEEFDAEAIDFGQCQDDAALIKRKIQEALLSCDMLVTSGGVSMGSADYLKSILEEIGQVHFGRLNMKPGKPTTFATVTKCESSTNSDGLSSTKFVFALPGNPVSCLVTARLLIQPALKSMYGLEKSQCLHSEVNAQLSSDIKLDPERPEYHRVQLEWSEGRFIAYSKGPQQSSRLLSLVECNGLLLVPKGTGIIEAGTFLSCMVVGELTPPSRHAPPTLLPQTLASSSSTSYALKTTNTTPTQTCCILTVSNESVEPSSNPMNVSSQAGAQLASYLLKCTQIDFQLLEMKVVTNPSELDIQTQIKDWMLKFQPLSAIFILGGCGLNKTDIVPEALEPLLFKKADMIAHLMNEKASYATESSQSNSQSVNLPWIASHRSLVGLSSLDGGTFISSSSSKLVNTIVATIPGIMNNVVYKEAINQAMDFLTPLLPQIAKVLDQ